MLPVLNMTADWKTAYKNEGAVEEPVRGSPRPRRRCDVVSRGRLPFDTRCLQDVYFSTTTR